MNLLQKLFTAKEEINYKELVKQGAIIIDVRSPEEFKHGHVHGARNLPLDTLQDTVSRIGTKETHIILCCQSGGRSAMAKNILHKAGYDHVHNGGGWKTLESKLQ